MRRNRNSLLHKNCWTSLRNNSKSPENYSDFQSLFPQISIPEAKIYTIHFLFIEIWVTKNSYKLISWENIRDCIFLVHLETFRIGRSPEELKHSAFLNSYKREKQKNKTKSKQTNQTFIVLKHFEYIIGTRILPQMVLACESSVSLVLTT